ncbi:hypothetical protein LINGRAHAP2_LOCUS18785 [Linum grandiflorum]
MTITLSASSLKPSPFTRFPLHHLSNPITFRPSLSTKPKPFAAKIACQRLGGFGFRNSRLEFSVNAQKGERDVEDVNSDGVEDDSTVVGGGSTLPDRFRYLTEEAPDPPPKWLLFTALGFILYTWRAVLFEFRRWIPVIKFPIGIFPFMADIIKLLIAQFVYFITHPVTPLLQFLETIIYVAHSIYTRILNYTSVSEFTLMILLSSAVLAVGEAAVPDSVSSQRYILTFAGLVGLAAVANYISEPLFWTVLVGMYVFSRWVRKRGDVAAALPAAAVFTAIGEPWVRVLVMGSYVGLAIYHHSKNLSREGEGEEVDEMGMEGFQVPAPLLCAAMAIGIKVAAKWAGYRHLTWMVV